MAWGAAALLPKTCLKTNSNEHLNSALVVVLMVVGGGDSGLELLRLVINLSNDN